MSNNKESEHNIFMIHLYVDYIYIHIYRFIYFFDKIKKKYAE